MKNKTLEEIGEAVSGVVNLFGIPEYLLKDFMVEFINFISKYKSKHQL